VGAAPADCLFVDDPSFVVAAIRLGYHGMAVLRRPGQRAGDVPFIRAIDALLTHL
jgi:FMN phosphatase YigB (HAD superfamily)